MKECKIETTEKYWDCECIQNYIHLKSKTECLICGARHDEQPDSRVNEVENMLNNRQG